MNDLAPGRARHRHGVPVLRALPVADGRGEHRLPALPRASRRRRSASGASRKAAETLDLTGVLDRLPGPDLRGREAARRGGARHRARPELLPLRRAAEPPRRRAPPDHARPDQGGADRPLQGDGDRHPRPARGADHGRPHRHHARRPHRADRLAARHLRQARQRLRRRLHRHAADEPGRGDARRASRTARRCSPSPTSGSGSPSIRRSRALPKGSRR